MYDYSGIVFRIWSMCGILSGFIIFTIIFGIIIDIAMHKKIKIKAKIKEHKTLLIILLLCILYALFLYSRIIFPNVESYTGEFIDSHRNSRVAPPLPVTWEYVFWNGEGYKEAFYLDTFSKRKIYPYEFEENHKYRIYYDSITEVIVRVEDIEE